MNAINLTAARAALRLRSRHGIGLDAAVDVYRLADLEGVEVRFLRIGSLEGIYLSQDNPIILLASERPAGRVSFTCAHELGHHVLEHGTRLDLPTHGGSTEGSVEWFADMFAAFLLMPKSAVERGMRRRSCRGRHIAPLQVLMLAQWLSVSYGALLSQCSRTLGLIPKSAASALSASRPRTIARTALGCDLDADVIFADRHWMDRPVDLRTGDLMAVPTQTTLEAPLLSPMGSARDFDLYRAIRPGIGRVIFNRNQPQFVRVYRKGYEGRDRYRFLEDPDLKVPVQEDAC